MKLTQERYLELKKLGAKVNRQQIVREKNEDAEKTIQVKQEPQKDDFTKEAINHLMTIAQQSETNINHIIHVNNQMALAITEISKPKPKKQWACSIGRNSRGDMTTVNISEI